jgi:hypothetical protein
MSIKMLPATALKLNDAGMCYQRWFGIVDDDLAVEDIYTPAYWGHYKGKIGLYDLIRLRSRDGSFDFQVTVMSLADNGDFNIENYPKYRECDGLSHFEAARAAEAAAEAARPTIVPLDPNTGDPIVRVEYLDAPGVMWRLRGVDRQEVSRGHPSESAAKQAMQQYLNYMRLQMPSQDDIDAAKALIAEKKAKKAEKLRKKEEEAA